MNFRSLSSTLVCLALLFTVSTGLPAQGEFRVTVLHCKLHGLVAVMKTPSGRAMVAEHPIVWTHEPRTGGRFFYTEFDHDLRSLSMPFVRQHIFEAIQWATRSTTATPKQK